MASASNPWEGVEESWDSSTNNANVDILMALINSSSAISGYPLTVKRISADNYEVNGDAKQAEAFTAEWQKLLAANSAGIAAMKDTLSPADFDKYSPKVFINSSEPVVDIELVIVLFNPVWSDYDQRNSATVNVWWEMFQEDTQQSSFWEQHSVFLDLVPILDPGYDNHTPDGTAAYNMVNDAAGGAVCTTYDMSRLNSYMEQFKANHPGKKFQLMLASGYTDSRNKKKAVDALKEALAPVMDSIDFYEYPVHPSSFTYGPNPKAREEYKVLNELFAKNTTGWVPPGAVPAYESIKAAIPGLQQQQLWDQVTQQYKNLIMLLTRAWLYADGVATEKEFIAATTDNIVKAGCGLELIVFQLALKDLVAANEAFADQTANLPGFAGSDQQALSAALIKAVTDSDYYGLKDALKGKAGDFNVSAVNQLAGSLITKPPSS